MINQTRLFVISQILVSYAQSMSENGDETPGERLICSLAREIQEMLPENPLVVERIVPIIVSDSIKIVAREQGKIPAIKKIREQYNLSLIDAKRLIESQCEKELNTYNNRPTPAPWDQSQ